MFVGYAQSKRDGTKNTKERLGITNKIVDTLLNKQVLCRINLTVENPWRNGLKQNGTNISHSNFEQ